jgi:hypothetical protein
LLHIGRIWDRPEFIIVNQVDELNIWIVICQTLKRTRLSGTSTSPTCPGQQINLPPTKAVKAYNFTVLVPKL